MFSRYNFRRETSGSRNHKHLQDQLVVLLLLSSLCCLLHAQSTASGPTSNSSSPTSSSSDSSGDFITSETNVITPETGVLISAPYAISTSSLYVFTTGIPIRPVYIQAPPVLMVWLTIQCRGGAARVTVPQFVANFTMVQTDPTGEWILPSLPLNSSWPVTGLGIKFNQNVSIANDALGTLLYGKGAGGGKQDIVGRAKMTITLNWNATSARDNSVIVFTKSKSIYVSAPTALTSLSTFRATVAGVCLLGIFGLCCFCWVHSVGVAHLRRFNVMMARETRDQLEIEQNRVFNPIWTPCAPSQPGYYNIESTPNPLLLAQRRMEINRQILRTQPTLDFTDLLMRVKNLKSRNHGCFGFRLPWATVPPGQQQLDWSSDDEFPVGVPVAPRRGSPQTNQVQEVAMMKQQLGARPESVQPPPDYESQQRAPMSFNRQQAQAQAAVSVIQNQMYPGAPKYRQQAAQVRVARYTTQNSSAPNYPQRGSLRTRQTMYPDNQHGTSQGPGAPGKRFNSETCIHHRFVRDVSLDAKPSPSLHAETTQLEKGKEPMSVDDYSSEPSSPDRILHTTGESLHPVSKLGNCELADSENVKGSLESGSVRLEGSLSELQSPSENFRSPLSELYEDVLESCSPTNNIPERFDGQPVRHCHQMEPSSS